MRRCARGVLRKFAKIVRPYSGLSLLKYRADARASDGLNRSDTAVTCTVCPCVCAFWSGHSRGKGLHVKIDFDIEKLHPVSDLQEVSEDMIASNPIAQPTSKESKALIDKFNDGHGHWIIGRAERDCEAAIW